jgi:SNF2 family DNA or RNA helicase
MLPISSVGSRSLHPHQVTAIQWMMEREKDVEARGGLLCDEMGLGKTLTTIGLMLNSPLKSNLILGPLAVLTQWSRAVLSSGAQSPAVYCIQKGKWVLVGGSLKNGRAFIANYDKLISNPLLFTGSYNRVICDEAHYLRNCRTKKAKYVSALKREITWCLTGTPLVNGLADLAAIVSLFKPSVNPKFTASLKECVTWMETYAMARTTDQIREHLAHLFPKPAIITQHRLPFSSEEEAIFYRGIQGRLTQQLQRLMEQEHMDMMMFLLLLLRLRQISVHPQVFIGSKKRSTPTYSRDDWTNGSTKTEAILRILREESGSHGYVIFCNFKDEMNILEALLKKEPSVQTVIQYSGEMSAEQRTEAVEASEDAVASGKGHVVMLAQIQCAGVGLNLQHMDRVIFTTPWWTAALMDQAAGRVLRLGQTRQVEIHYIALEEEDESSLNIDDYMNERVEMKRTLCKDLLAAANHTVKTD